MFVEPAENFPTKNCCEKVRYTKNILIGAWPNRLILAAFSVSFQTVTEVLQKYNYNYLLSCE